MKNVRIMLVLTLGLSLTAAVSADEIFAIQGDQSLTRAELDAAFAEIPEVHRLPFIRDGARVDQLVQKLLRSRQIAAAARAEGFDQDPLVANRMKLAAENELAAAWMENVVANAPEADYLALAEEYYLANPEQFMTPELRDVSHILIGSETRSEEDALALIEEVKARLDENPAQFDALVEEFSEDPAKKSNAGRYPAMKRGEMVKPFEEAAYALQQDGEISVPVKTSYGYHLIRLNRVIPSAPIPFEEVREQLVEQSKKNYLAEYRERYIIDVTSEPIDIQEGAVEAMLKQYFGEDLELAPRFEER